MQSSLSNLRRRVVKRSSLEKSNYEKLGIWSMDAS